MYIRTCENQSASSDSIYYNTLIKTYRDGSKQILCASKRIFREPGWEDVWLTRLKQTDTLSNFEIEADRVLSLLCDITGDLNDLNYDALERQQSPEETISGGPEEPEDVEAAIRAEESKKLANLRRAIRRARVKVRDYALSTDMHWFVTLTLDQNKVGDRKDIHKITRKLNIWLNHQVERHGLTYIMVPELHKDGSVHFHALFNNALAVVDSGTIIPRGGDKPRRPLSDRQRTSWLNNGGRIVYNLPAWDYGFTTALQLEGNYEKAVNYVSKYISKYISDDAVADGNLPTKIGGRWYYSGGDLKSPEREYCNNNLEDIAKAFGEAAWRVNVEDMTDVQMVVIWIDAEGIPRVRKQRDKAVKSIH